MCVAQVGLLPFIMAYSFQEPHLPCLNPSKLRTEGAWNIPSAISQQHQLFKVLHTRLGSDCMDFIFIPLHEILL